MRITLTKLIFFLKRKTQILAPYKQHIGICIAGTRSVCVKMTCTPLKADEFASDLVSLPKPHTLEYSVLQYKEQSAQDDVVLCDSFKSRLPND